MTIAQYPVSGGGGGTISGPGSSINNGIVLWNGIDGTVIKDGGVGSANQVLVSDGTTPSFALLTNSNISSSAAIDYSKLATLTANRALVSSVLGVVSASSVTSTELGLLSGRSTGLVDTASTQTVGGSKTFSSALNTPSVNLTATSNQMAFGSGANKITINVPNNPAANLTYSFPNIAAVSLTGTVVLLEGANQTFTGNNTAFSNTVRFNSATPLFLGDTPNRVILLPATQTSPSNWTFPNLGDCTFAALEGTQTFSGTKTFSSALTISPTSNQLVLGVTNTTTISATAPSASRVYTLPDVGGAADFVMTAGSQTIGGAKTFSSAVTVSASSNQLVLHSGINQLTINSGTSAAARTYSVPDVGATGTFAMLEGAQTFSALKTFSSGLAVTGGSAGNGTIWFASNVLRQRGGTSGWAVDNTSGTAILSATDAGALTVGPTSGGGLENFVRSGGNTIWNVRAGTTSNTATLTLSDGVNNDIYLRRLSGANASFSILSDATTLFTTTSAGAVTWGPGSGSAGSINHLTRGTQRLTTIQYAVTSGGVSTETTPTTTGSNLSSVITSFTDLSTTARNVASGVGVFTAGIHNIILINVDGDEASFQVSVGLEAGVAFKFNPITGSNANCSITGTSTLSITGLGDGRTYTLAFNGSSGAATLASSSTATGTTTLYVYGVRRY